MDSCNVVHFLKFQKRTHTKSTANALKPFLSASSDLVINSRCCLVVTTIQPKSSDSEFDAGPIKPLDNKLSAGRVYGFLKFSDS